MIGSNAKLFDASEYQGIDWSKVDALGGWARTREWNPNRPSGNHGPRPDRQIVANVSGAAGAAKFLGGYDRLYPEVEAVQAATEFMSTMAGRGLLSTGRLFAAADIEPTGITAVDDAMWGNWHDWTVEFFRSWSRLTASAPVLLYSSRSFLETHIDVDDLPVNVWLWQADWTPGPGETHNTGGRVLVHQHALLAEPGAGGVRLLDSLMPGVRMDEVLYT